MTLTQGSVCLKRRSRRCRAAGRRASVCIYSRSTTDDQAVAEAVKKLSIPIGKDGSVFRDSLIDNMVEVSTRMDRVCLSDDPLIRQQITG